MCQTEVLSWSEQLMHFHANSHLMLNISKVLTDLINMTFNSLFVTLVELTPNTMAAPIPNPEL